MQEHPIQGMMRTAMESLKTMVDVGTVVGDPVETREGMIIIPVSRVSFGFAAGGGEYGGPLRRRQAGYDQNQYDDQSQQGGMDGGSSGSMSAHPFGGGSGAGVSVQPVGFLVCGPEGVRMLHVERGQVMDKLVEMMPDLIEKARGLMGSGSEQGHMQIPRGEDEAKRLGRQLEGGNQSGRGENGHGRQNGNAEGGPSGGYRV